MITTPRCAFALRYLASLANTASQVLADAESANTDEYFAQKTLLENELEALGQSIRKDEQQLKKLEEKLSEDSDKLGKVKGHMKQKQQEEEFVKLLVSLKEQFGDENVLGRVEVTQLQRPLVAGVDHGGAAGALREPVAGAIRLPRRRAALKYQT